ERPACTIFSYQTVLGCAVAPNKPDLSKLPGCSELRKAIAEGKLNPNLTAQCFIEDRWIWGFRGDGRGFTNAPADGTTNTFRTTATVEGYVNPYHPGGIRTEISGRTGVTSFLGVLSAQARASLTGSMSQADRPYSYSVSLSASASDPLVPGAPPAAHGISAIIDYNSGVAYGAVSYTNFPGLQVFVGDQPVFNYSANEAGRGGPLGPTNLYDKSTGTFSQPICDPSR
ncbi:MAG: hypothetical protein ACREIA_00780, partial [Opitutaceae bacterium]